MKGKFGHNKQLQLTINALKHFASPHQPGVINILHQKIWMVISG